MGTDVLCHGVFLPCCVQVSMLSWVSFPAPGNLDIIHSTVFKLGGVTEAGELPVKSQPGLWMRHHSTPSFTQALHELLLGSQ